MVYIFCNTCISINPYITYYVIGMYLNWPTSYTISTLCIQFVRNCIRNVCLTPKSICSPLHLNLFVPPTHELDCTLIFVYSYSNVTITIYPTDWLELMFLCLTKPLNGRMVTMEKLPDSCTIQIFNHTGSTDVLKSHFASSFNAQITSINTHTVQQSNVIIMQFADISGMCYSYTVSIILTKYS